MTETELLDVLKVLDTIVEKAQLRCSEAEAAKASLGALQRDLESRGLALIETMDDAGLLEPGAFRLLQLRFRHADQTRRSLQPRIVDAAIMADLRREELKSVLRKEAAVDHLLGVLRSKKNATRDETAELVALRLFAGRGQRTS